MAKARTKVQVPLTAITFSGGRMIEEINARIDEALADCATRSGDWKITVSMTICPNDNGRVIDTTHKVGLKVPRAAFEDHAYINEGESGAVVDLRLDPGTNQLDLERMLKLNVKE